MIGSWDNDSISWEDKFTVEAKRTKRTKGRAGVTHPVAKEFWKGLDTCLGTAQ